MRFNKCYFLTILTILAQTALSAQTISPPWGIHISSGDEDSETTGDFEHPDPIYNQIPIGMNIDTESYWSPNLIFTDLMKSASIYVGDKSSEYYEVLEIDEQGYPTYFPQSGWEDLRIVINNYYSGRYRLFYDGVGEFEGTKLRQDTKGYYIDLDGSGSNTVIYILSSQESDHVRNLRIVPEQYEESDTVPTFQQAYLDALEPFHALRFMDFCATNNSEEVEWSDRTPEDWISQSTQFGASYECAIELCNELQADAWICVPHMASDDYITQMAELWRDNLDSGLNIYLEYSNEVWNWGFEQTTWVYQNAPGSADSYITSALSSLAGLPEKHGYMMARTFEIWKDVFGAQGSRVIRVATGQQAWAGNTERMMKYLFDVDGGGCDMLSVAGYFPYGDEQHNSWLTAGSSLTYEQMYQDMKSRMEEVAGWTRLSAAVANKYGVPYIIYEGGQHMVLRDHSESWSYTDNLYDFQVSPQMYDLYMYNFSVHIEPEVDCQLFMAYRLMSERCSIWGSWGHLENLDQVENAIFYDAPKYQALIDINTSR